MASTRAELFNGDSDMVARTGTNAITFRVSDTIATTLDAWKQFLRDEYAAGTPVTVWYVLNEAQTTIVNEPLMKIGDYSDTVASSNQGAPQIPKWNGQNTLSIDTTVQPSAVSLTYLNGKTYHLSHTVSGESGTPVTTTIQLGQTPTVRRVRKLVLTGEETVAPYDTTYNRFSIVVSDWVQLGVRKSPLKCSHYQAIYDGRGIADVPDNSVYSDGGMTYRMFFKTTDYTDATTWKAYLAQQYAAGHPVTVWYVLNEAQTATLDEPLMKIGDYSDKLTVTDQDVTIDIPEGNGTLSIDTTVPPSKSTIVGHLRERSTT